MAALTNDQQIKILLLGLAEYLQVPLLSDALVRSYSHDLRDLGPENLARAIALLKRDPEAWAGRFPLPAKLRAYLQGNVETRAVEGARRIMACPDAKSVYELPEALKNAARQYGVSTIIDRQAGTTPTIFAQLREILTAEFKMADRAAALEAADNELRLTHQEAQLLPPIEEAAPSQTPERSAVEARPSRAAKGRGANRGAN